MIEIKKRNGEKKVIPDYELEKEVNDIMQRSVEEINELLTKLKRGDHIGLNDIHFKYCE